MRRRLPVALAALVFAAAAGRATELPRKGATWIAVDTPAFRVLSNAAEEPTRRLLTDLETFRSALATLLGEATTTAALPTLVYLFRNSEDFSRYDDDLRECRGTRCTAGWFLAARQANLVSIDASAEEAARVALHEYVHFLVENTSPGLPLWLNEGLAEFYSTFRATPRGAEVGRPIENHLRLLREQGLLPLAQLFAVDYNSPLYREHERAGVFYAQSWALTHRLLVGDEERGREAGGELIARLAAGEAPEPVLAGVLGLGPAELQRSLAAYVRGRLFNYELLPRSAAPVPEDFELRPVARAEALGRLGYLLAQFVDRALAATEEHCAAALAETPSEGWALLGRAQAALTLGDRDAAETLAAAAASASPDEPLAHELLGHALLDRARSLRLSELPPGFDAARRARSSFERAVELAPGLAPALAGLGLSYYWDADPTPGLAPSRAAARRMPHREDLVFDYLSLASRAGDVEKAQEAYDLLVRQGSRLAQENLADARSALFQAKLTRWQQGIHGPEDYAAALTELDELLTRAPDAAARQEWADERRELARTVERNELVTLYNRAVALANGGHREEAAELLQRVAASSTDPLLAMEAGELLRRLQR